MVGALIAFGLMTSHGVSHVASIAAVAVRLRRKGRMDLRPDQLPPVTLLRPVRGLENFIEESLRTSFALTYPKLELIFCVDDADDPIVPLLDRLIAEHPNVNARRLVGRDRISANPKLNNLVKGWNAATSDWILMSDSNALLPPDFIEMLMASWRPGTGVLSTAATVTQPANFAAELECAFVNTVQAKWMLVADLAGTGFAQGRTLLWQRHTLEKLGGLAVLGREAAEDVASTKALRGTGLKPRLARHPLPQAIGRRRFRDVWKRQVRWARLRRSGFPLIYPAEIFMGAAVPFTCALAVTIAGVLPVWGLAAYVAAWYCLEALLARAGGMPLTPRMPLAWLVRDFLLPVVWIAGLIGNSFEWRGNAMSANTTAEGPPPTRWR